MSRLEVWFMHLATLLVGGTGIVYAVMRYLLEPEDAYGVVNHPLEPRVQHLHVLAAPLLVFAVGVIWRRHVWSSWRSGQGERRASGLGLILSLAPMVVSGYLVQVAVSGGWRAVWVATHGAASALWLLGYAMHLVLRGAAAPGTLAAEWSRTGGASDDRREPGFPAGRGGGEKRRREPDPEAIGSASASSPGEGR